MEHIDALDMSASHLNENFERFEDVEASGNVDEMAEMNFLTNCYNEMVSKVKELEQKVDKVANFYSSLNATKQAATAKGSSVGKGKDKDQRNTDIKNQHLYGKESASAKRIQELMRQFATILRQLAQHKWAYPFLEPVDVKALGLHDYYEVIDKPMDFSTIKTKMEAKDSTGYKNVREIYADVKLVFKNAMTYNDDKNDVHVMAKSLLDKFNEKWLQLLPKVIEEEKRQKEEEVEVKMNLQLAEEANINRDTLLVREEIKDVDISLNEIRELVLQKCRKISVEEKRNLGKGFSQLSPEDLTKALEIIAQSNSNFQATAPEVDIDMDAQSEYTLWRLKFLVNDALEAKNKIATAKSDNEKRKKVICAALTQNKKKKK